MLFCFIYRCTFTCNGFCGLVGAQPMVWRLASYFIIMLYRFIDKYDFLFKTCGDLFIKKIVNKEVFETLLQSNSLKIERIISHGQTSPTEYEWYDQKENEWITLLKGAATLLFENGKEVHLKSGDYLNIPSHVKHKVTWTHPEEETVWLAVYY